MTYTGFTHSSLGCFCIYNQILVWGKKIDKIVYSDTLIKALELFAIFSCFTDREVIGLFHWFGLHASKHLIAIDKDFLTAQWLVLI